MQNKKVSDKKNIKVKTPNKEIKKENIENILINLDKITKEMEDEKCTLEKSFELYQKGLALTKDAKEAIEEMEGKIKILEEN